MYQSKHNPNSVTSGRRETHIFLKMYVDAVHSGLLADIGDERWRTAVAILHEELTDPDAYKGTHNEYPILSETQLARRREGKHKRRGSGMGGETSLAIVQDTGTDGRSYRKPSRRKRSPYEYRFVDESARIRNKQRREQYEKYRKPGEVKEYFIE